MPRRESFWKEAERRTALWLRSNWVETFIHQAMATVLLHDLSNDEAEEDAKKLKGADVDVGHFGARQLGPSIEEADTNSAVQGIGGVVVKREVTCDKVANWGRTHAAGCEVVKKDLEWVLGSRGDEHGAMVVPDKCGLVLDVEPCEVGLNEVAEDKDVTKSPWIMTESIAEEAKDV
eukprot:jgi/Psemu1/45369/gm1.45369_g